jgi:uncharacterized lipoprotein YmbA
VPTLSLTRILRILLLAALLPLAGCFSLSRNAPPALHYVLAPGGAAGEPDAPILAAERGAGAGFVGVRPARMADYLASPFIVVRRGAHQVEFTEHHRWGEDLGRAINRGVAGRLSAAAPLRVEAAPWPAGTSPSRVIQLHILRFEGVAPQTGEPSSGGEGASGAPVSGEAHFQATWEVLHPLEGTVLARGTTEVRDAGWRVGDFHGLVRLLDASLEILARDLAQALEALGRDPAPPGTDPLPPSGDLRFPAGVAESTAGARAPPPGEGAPLTPPMGDGPETHSCPTFMMP